MPENHSLVSILLVVRLEVHSWVKFVRDFPITGYFSRISTIHVPLKTTRDTTLGM